MELMNRRVKTITESWTHRSERGNLAKVNYKSELKSWLQFAISEAESKKDFHKKDQLLDLLNDL